MSKPCPLCRDSQTELFDGPLQREYYKCAVCGIRFVDSKYYISEEKSRIRYLKHNNSSEFDGYKDYLIRAVKPSERFLKTDLRVLDYGCGPSPVLSGILKEMGVSSDYYDPNFFPEGLKKEKYDLIFSTETFEHFREPSMDLNKINGLLFNGGYLVVMTSLVTNKVNFINWHYARDLTHILFYSSETFRYISKKFSFKILYNDKRSVLILKKESGELR